jgi:hypothetical protein
MELRLQIAQTRLEELGFKFIDVGCFERTSDSLTVQLGQIPEGLIIRPLDAETMEPTAPNYLCEADAEFEQSLKLLGAIAA